jgi:hypothetical protein
MRMQRQKVKGTGHKQPADAQTEPNFYTMPPSQAQHPQPTSTPAHYSEMSPGLQGLHGAAHLLKGIAAGLPASSLNTSLPFSLGGTAAAPAMSSNNMGLDVPYPQALPAASASVLQPRRANIDTYITPTVDRSVSLLGRVTASHPTGASGTSPSAFFWPPARPSASNAKRNEGNPQEVSKRMPSSSSATESDDEIKLEGGDIKSEAV